MARVKDQILSIFKTKDYSKPKRVKTVYGDGKKQSEENIIIFKQEDDYHKPIRVANFWNNNYVKYKSSGDRN